MLGYVSPALQVDEELMAISQMYYRQERIEAAGRYYETHIAPPPKAALSKFFSGVGTNDSSDALTRMDCKDDVALRR